MASRQRLRFGNGCAKALPRDDRGYRTIGVSLAVARGDQGGADAGVETDLFIDGPRVGLEGTGLPALGLAEHRADQPVEQVDRLVGQARRDVQHGGDQRRVPALPLVAGDVLNRGATGLTSELRQARLMDEVAATGLDADGAHMLQPLDQAEHGGGRGSLRHLPQPGEPAQIAPLPVSGERVEAFALLDGKPAGQPAMRLPPRAMTQFDA